MNAEPGGDTLFGIRPRLAFGSSSRSRRRNGTGWGRNGWTAARTVELIAAVTASGRPPWAGVVLVRYSPRAVGLAAGAAVGLPGAPAGGRGELVFPAVDSGGRSVGAGRCNRPCVACIGDCASARAPRLDGSPSVACCVRAAHSLSSEAPIPLPGNSPAMVPATVAAIPCLPLPAVDLGTPPGDVAEPARRPSASPHDRWTCNRPETGTRLSLSPSWSAPPSNGSFEVSR